MITFKGYVRPDGTVGVRNHVIAVATTCCANGVIERIAREVPGVIPLIHTDGCGAVGEAERFHKTIVGICKNPNNYAAIIIGLGCEADDAKQVGREVAAGGKPVFASVIQEDGGSDKVAVAAIEAAKKLLEDAKKCERQDVPISKLILGTECGGSDALSGVTANPAIGYVSDWVVANGGTSILTETTELVGTEHLLAARAATKEVADKIYKIIYDTEEEVRKVMGPTASRVIARGNMEGGMSTIQEKSLGCVRKGGTSTIMEVIDYADPIPESLKGLIIMDGPGYDTDSMTGMFASGAQVALFSSGRGNPIGFPSAPVIKLCSNPLTYESVGGDGGDMDINCGRIISEGISPKELGEYCVSYLLDVLDGKQTMPEAHNQGGALCIYQTTRPF
ncbi:MAG TPA: UxaA family hydrolase [Candidatus Acidoferrum sp.]|nr:UxaA family hydrolase [Candidatus Acidoferrum sp.]